jgi:hypothetical protein
MVNYDRPLGLSLMAYLLWVFALVLISFSVYALLFGGKFWYDGILQVFDSRVLQIIILIIFSLLLIFSGIGILTSSPAARGLLIALSGLVVVHGLLVLSTDFTRGLLAIVVSGCVLGYMLTSGVSEVFSPMDSRKGVDAIDTLESYRRTRNL